MAIITGGNIITGNTSEGSAPQSFYVRGEPDPDGELAGTVSVGDLAIDVDSGHVYEYTEPGSTPTFTRIDTVD